MKHSAELTSILTRFASSGWDVIDAPSRAYLNGTGDMQALIDAIRQADEACGSCGCAYDPLYKRALQLLSGKPAKASGPLSNDFCPQTMFLYGTKKEDGSPNFGLFCWFSYCADGGLSVMAAIGGSKLTKDRIQKTGMFSANLVTAPMLPLADYLGNTHGYDSGKMDVPVAVMQGAVLDVPVLSDSPVSFELEVSKTIPLDGSDIFICKIRNVLLSEALLDTGTSTEARLAALLPASTTCKTYFTQNSTAAGTWGNLMQSYQK